MRYRQAVLAALCLGLAGCGTPEHSNMLMFGTNTSFGVDIAASPTTATPAIKIGYDRQEIALIPLLANKTGEKRQPADCGTTKPPGDCAFVGDGPEGHDAYSVLGTFSGSGGASGTDGAKVQIAQYFATGLAARILAQQGGAQLVSTKADAPATSALADAIIQNQTSNIALVDKALSDATFQADLKTLVDKAYPNGGATAAVLNGFTAKPALMTYLGKQYAITNKLAAATKS